MEGLALTAQPDLLETKLDTYVVEALLGRGGMSTVYRGFDTKLQRPVAIKVLAGAVADQPGFADRFRREAQLLGRLRHPYIVQVYDLGEHEGLLYMVQELLAGPTLEARLAALAKRGQRLGREDVLAIARDMASALDAAHAEGVVHRDVKPSNMICNAAGALVLTDFGIAKDARDDERHTRTGVIIGTPTYLSPEQAQGLPLTPASDIYSLGVVLYELIAGRPPFEAPAPIAVALSHVQRDPAPLRMHRPDLPYAAELVIGRALTKDPAARFQSAGELARALEVAWAATPAGAAEKTTIGLGLPAVKLPPARMLLPRVAVALGLLLAGGGGLATRGGATADLIDTGSVFAPFAPPTPAPRDAAALQAIDPFLLPGVEPIATAAPPTTAPPTRSAPTARSAAQPPRLAVQSVSTQPAQPKAVPPKPAPPAPKPAPQPKAVPPKPAPQPKAQPKPNKPEPPKAQPKPAPQPKKDDKPKDSGKQKDHGGDKGGGDKGGGSKKGK
jgi:serine/threonine-protein kinase